MTMKAKIDLEKFICSLMKRFYKIHNIDPLTTKCWLDKVLEDQGLEYRDGEIVEIPQDSEDERIRKELIENFKWFCGDFPETTKWGKDDNLLVKDIIAWLEKQGKEDSSIQQAYKQGYIEGQRIERKCWLEKQGEQNLASSAKISKNEDTFLDLLQKMPSCITVDGIDYHFVMKKTSIYIAYYACYKGNGEEGRGNAIFGITAHSPIDLLTEMLEILKEKGLL